MKKILNTILTGTIGFGLGVVGSILLTKQPSNTNNDKHKIYYNTLNQWLKIKNQGKNLSKYFKDNGFNSIAIYGMGELGNRLYEELKDSDITVLYGIDQCAQSAYSDLKVYSLDDNLETADAVVVTAVFAYDEIKSTISNKIKGQIISLEDVVFEL